MKLGSLRPTVTTTRSRAAPGHTRHSGRTPLPVPPLPPAPPRALAPALHLEAVPVVTVVVLVTAVHVTHAVVHPQLLLAHHQASARGEAWRTARPNPSIHTAHVARGRHRAEGLAWTSSRNKRHALGKGSEGKALPHAGGEDRR